jgi:hypothetical protein
MEKHFREHFGMFVNKIQNNEPFAFARYSDGELFILQNKVLKLAGDVYQVGDAKHPSIYKAEDHKEFNPEIHTEFRKKLIEAYKYKQPNYYKGISCSCCVGKEAFDWQVDLHGGDDESLSWANLWVNGNYPLFIQHMLTLFYSKNCVFVGHENADLSKLPFFVKDFRVGYNAMINDYGKIDDIKKWIKENNIENHIFLFSASTFSNLAIYELFKEFPNNSYIDIGTCLTPMMNMPTDRDYLQRFWGYVGGGDLNKICIWN